MDNENNPMMLAGFEDWDAATRFFEHKFDRSTFAKKNTDPFCDFFELDRLHRSGRFRNLFGRIRFSVTGFPPSEPFFQDMEARAYLKDLAVVWPYFFYADSLENDFLPHLIFCMASNLKVQTYDKKPGAYGVMVNKSFSEIPYKLLKEGFECARQFDSLMTEQMAKNRMDEVREHLKKHFQDRKSHKVSN